jgi:hypothetical protein
MYQYPSRTEYKYTQFHSVHLSSVSMLDETNKLEYKETANCERERIT